ncbi:MAG: c-type cytochrome [Opitutus sp.]
MSEEVAKPADEAARRRNKHLTRGIVFGIAAAAIGAAVFQMEKRSEISIVVQGRDLATTKGCFACHGTGDADPRGNLRKTSDGIWKAKAIPTFWENGIDKSDVLVDWITHGVPAEEAENHKRLFIQMPAYETFMTPAEIQFVSAWILSEAIHLTQNATSPDPAATPTLSPEQVRQLKPDELLVMGDHLSRKHGCYQCHGELGQGGRSNPASFKNTIPGFFGRDFRELTNRGDRADVLHWIEEGRGRSIETGPLGFLAKRYLDSQAIPMPAYRDQLTATEKSILTEYLLLLNKKGPLTAVELEQFLKVLTDDSAAKS